MNFFSNLQYWVAIFCCSFYNKSTNPLFKAFGKNIYFILTIPNIDSFVAVLYVVESLNLCFIIVNFSQNEKGKVFTIRFTKLLHLRPFHSNLEFYRGRNVGNNVLMEAGSSLTIIIVTVHPV